MSDSPAAFATVGLSSVRTKVIVFTLSAAMAGLGGVFYAGQQGGIGANDVQFIGSLPCSSSSPSGGSGPSPAGSWAV